MPIVPLFASSGRTGRTLLTNPISVTLILSAVILIENLEHDQLVKVRAHALEYLLVRREHQQALAEGRTVEDRVVVLVLCVSVARSDERLGDADVLDLLLILIKRRTKTAAPLFGAAFATPSK